MEYANYQRATLYVGNNQTKGTFWTRVSEKFHEIKKKKAKPGHDVFFRKNDKLSGKRFHIKRNVGKFHGVYREVERNRPSGARDVDLLNIAITRYRDDHNSAPLVEHYNILKKSPKFNEIMESTSTSGKKRSSTYMDSPMG
ncbi:hypothetical protein SSX86_018540 [Deinandra increscens subsp. villosa]|uniref:Uncharacterized protein n=1 Tax=Deinandra increscens subsp. villosa TaxID=3103831 RepID=A0AAP0CY19_9ASTR